MGNKQIWSQIWLVTEFQGRLNSRPCEISYMKVRAFFGKEGIWEDPDHPDYTLKLHYTSPNKRSNPSSPL